MYLFYNADMLEKAGFTNEPASVEEMVTMAKALKSKGIVEYPFVFSLAQAEALICVYSNFLEAFGGSFQDANGNWILNNSGIPALEFLVSLKNEGLLNPNSLEYLEEDVRRVFSSGDAAFTLNWAYMYSLAIDPNESSLQKDSVGVMVLPGAKGVKDSAAMSGSMGLSVINKTKHPDEAFAYIQHLTSKKKSRTPIQTCSSLSGKLPMMILRLPRDVRLGRSSKACFLHHERTSKRTEVSGSKCNIPGTYPEGSVWRYDSQGSTY